MSVNVTPTTRLLMRKVHGFKVMWTCLGWCVFLVLVHPAISNPLLVSGSSLYISANSDNTLCMNRYSGVTTTPPRRLLLPRRDRRLRQQWSGPSRPPPSTRD